MSSFVNIKYNTPPLIKWSVNQFNILKYKLIRPIVSTVLYYTKHKNTFRNIHLTFDGKPLKKGVSVYIPCKDEETYLQMCLESLIDHVDHIILIDNGSTDNTLQIMKSFQAEHGHRLEIEVHSKPEMLLVEMVQFALTRVQYSWVLKWDGDMLAVNEENQFSDLISKCLQMKRPAAYIMPRINLTGDYSHVSVFSRIIDDGEPFLRTFNNQFLFQEEFGRLEHAVIPLYYKLAAKRKFFSFHFSNLRPPVRIMYRHCYLDWRETLNTTDVAEIYKDFNYYRKEWFKYNFGSDDEATIKYRSGLLIASMCKKFDVRQYCDLPEVIRLQIARKEERFTIDYKDDAPFLMMDHQDPDMVNYTPTPEDNTWKPNYHLFFNDDIRMKFSYDKN